METTISLEIPRTVFYATHMTPQDFKLELALTLFQQGKLSFGKARELAGLTVWAFQDVLGQRAIPIHYDVMDYEQDMENLRSMGRI